MVYSSKHICCKKSVQQEMLLSAYLSSVKIISDTGTQCVLHTLKTKRNYKTLGVTVLDIGASNISVTVNAGQKTMVLDLTEGQEATSSGAPIMAGAPIYEHPPKYSNI